MSRRGNGEGSIAKRADGRWQGQVSLGRDLESGKPIRKTIYGKTRKEVADKIKIILAEQQKGFQQNTARATLEEKINYWLYQKKKLSLNANTWSTYETCCRVHIIPAIGHVEISKVTKQLLQLFISKKSKSHSPATVKKIYSIIQQVLEDAVDDNLILRNPANKIALPKIQQKILTPLTQKEMTALLKVCYGTRIYPVIFVEYGTGLRRSEILALTWDNIDFENKTIFINKRYIMVDSKPLLQHDTKTAASKLPISIPDEIIKYLTTLPRTCEFVFPQKNGIPMNPNNFLRDFKAKVGQAIKLLQKDDPTYNGMSNICFHDLRHNYASQLVALNIHQRLIQAQMRHSDSRTTTRYSHITTAGQEHVASVLNDQLLTVIKH